MIELSRALQISAESERSESRREVIRNNYLLDGRVLLIRPPLRPQTSGFGRLKRGFAYASTILNVFLLKHASRTAIIKKFAMIPDPP